jgi:hypothetical protein
MMPRRLRQAIVGGHPDGEAEVMRDLFRQRRGDDE